MGDSTIKIHLKRVTVEHHCIYINGEPVVVSYLGGSGPFIGTWEYKGVTVTYCPECGKNLDEMLKISGALNRVKSIEAQARSVDAYDYGD